MFEWYWRLQQRRLRRFVEQRLGGTAVMSRTERGSWSIVIDTSRPGHAQGFGGGGDSRRKAVQTGWHYLRVERGCPFGTARPLSIYEG